MNQKFSKIIKSSFNVVSILLIISLWSGISYYSISKISSILTSNENTNLSNGEALYIEEQCNVHGINLHGSIVTYDSNDAYNYQYDVVLDQTSADNIIFYMDKAQKDENIKAILIEIDSYGGSPVAGEEIMNTLRQSQKPVVAFIRDAGLSAAYLAATGAETIFASKFSNIGSIGITMSYLEEVEKNEKEGLSYIDLSSAKYKDTGLSERKLSEEEKILLMRDVNLSHKYFIEIIAENRNLKINDIRRLADGSSMMGEAALENGLIDKIGTFSDALNFLSEKIGTQANICWTY